MWKKTWINEPRYNEFFDITNIIQRPKRKIYLGKTNYIINARWKINAEQINSKKNILIRMEKRQQPFSQPFIICHRLWHNSISTSINFCSSFFLKWYMKCFIYWTADLKSSELWSSQLRTQFKQLRIEAWKSQAFNGVWTRDFAIPVRRSNQLSYEALDVGNWSFVISNEPVKNGCEVIYVWSSEFTRSSHVFNTTY